MTRINVAAEGACDVRAVEKIAELCGHEVNASYDCRGKSRLDARLQGYLKAAEYQPWVILRDLDLDADCAPLFLREKRIVNSKSACFRIACRSLEAWLLADHDGMSEWLGVRKGHLPKTPERLINPKQTIIDLASASRKTRIRERLVPRLGDGARVGPEYGAALFEFVDRAWDVQKAIDSGFSSSLNKAVLRMSEL